MNFSRRHLLGGIGAASAALVSPRVFALPRTAGKPDLLQRALAALDRHGNSIPQRDRIGLVDFSLRSAQPRLQIVDIGNGRIVSTHLVAHGRGSDPANTGILQQFSNRPGSNASCEGSFLTGGTYYGKHGRSRRVLGLDPANSNAANRAIVIHGADYVSQPMARNQGRVGRSLGCFSVPRRDIEQVLALLGPERLLFAGR